MGPLQLVRSAARRLVLSSEERSALSLSSLKEVDLRHIIDNYQAGENVTPRNVMSITAYWAAVRAIAETIGTLPRHLYAEDDKGDKRRDTKNPLYSLIRFEPNEYQSGPVFWETIVAHAVSWGNGYAYITWDGARAASMDLLLPDRTRACIEKGRLVYKTWLLQPDGTTREQTLRPDQVFHLPGLGFDGLSGYSPIVLFARTLGITIATEKYSSKFFSNGAAPSMILTHPAVFKNPEARENLKASIEEQTQGENFRRALILQEGMKVDKWGINPQEAQLIDLAKFSVEQVARIMRVPPHMIGHLDKATFSNIEHLGLEFSKYALRPWLVKLEAEIRRKLIPYADHGRVYVEFNLDAVERGDLKSRYEAYAIGRQWGWLSANDVCRKENQPLIPNGETYLEPLNMLPAGSHPDGGPEAKKKETQKRALTLAGIFLDGSMRRLAVKEANAMRKAGDPTPEAWSDAMAERHAELVGRDLSPTFDALGVAADLTITPERRAAFVGEYLATLRAFSAKLWTSRAAMDLDDLVELRITTARGMLLSKLTELLSPPASTLPTAS